MYYRFNNSSGEYFDVLFENVDKARDFAYKCGYCFLGRTIDFQTGYFAEKSKENIRRMIESAENKKGV